MNNPMDQEQHVRVGVAVFLYDESRRFLLGLRKGSHGAGTWGLPGGHIEFGETVRAAAVREVAEETGMVVDIPSILPAGWSESQFPEYGRHYVTVFVAARTNYSYVPRIIEPEKCAEWRWVTWMKTLPGPLFPPLASFLLHNDPPQPRW